MSEHEAYSKNAPGTLYTVCTNCGARQPLAAGIADADARRAVAAALKAHGPLAGDLLVYLGLHAPRGRSIAWAKLARLLDELVTAIDSGAVTYKRETRAAPVQVWREGIQEVLRMRDSGSLDLPLDGHGLLTSIVLRLASKAGAAQAAADRPLHPSHRPAARADADASRQAGAQHVSTLLGALGRSTHNTDETMP